MWILIQYLFDINQVRYDNEIYLIFAISMVEYAKLFSRSDKLLENVFLVKSLFNNVEMALE